MINKNYDPENYKFKINDKILDFSDSKKITIVKEANCIDIVEVEFYLETQKIKVDKNAKLYFIVGDKKYIVQEIKEVKND